MAALRLPIVPDKEITRLQGINRAAIALALACFLTCPLSARVAGMSLREALTAEAAGQEIRTDANSEPLVRVLAASVNVMLAETNDFNREMAASGLIQILTTDKLTPASPVLSRCNRIAALGPRAIAWGKRYEAYIAAGRKQGEIEIAQHQLDPVQLAGFLDGFSEQRDGFERVARLYAAMAPDDAALCEIFAHRRWEVTPAGEIQFFNEKDRQQALSLFAQLQPRLDEMRAMYSGVQDTLKKELPNLPQ